LSNPIAIGTLVWYHNEGWRVGWLEQTNGHSAVVRPIPAKGGAKMKLVKVPIEDIRET
jgi:hypothetical protein